MPILVVGNTELIGSKLKKGKGFLKPNLETLPSPVWFEKVVRCIQAKYLARCECLLYPITAVSGMIGPRPVVTRADI